ncbi:YdcF family protein [Kingella potus]|uniref:YdcF family protein n=1 Tax=Kingella potus TaxID=265175 RepID=UPI001FD15BD9|nr:YdcF family protein [Kingella potus]UOP00874.1 YdcF family protein [Kingella potus]
MWGSLWRGFVCSVLLVLLFFAWCGWSVYRTGQAVLPADYAGDAAVVLGAAAWDSRPSPVFRERINHAVGLYRGGRVRKLVFTGGAVKKGFMSEGEVGRRYALKQGVPAEDILSENKSRTTYENLAYLRAPLREAGLRKIVIVSDPPHLARAAAVARDLGLDAEVSPTPTTRYAEGGSRFKFQLRETMLLAGYYFWRGGRAVMVFFGFGR